MTVIELYDHLSELVQEGHGDVRVLFDTEAQCYGVHMVSVDAVYYEEDPEPHVGLSEDHPHRSGHRGDGWETT